MKREKTVVVVERCAFCGKTISKAFGVATCTRCCEKKCVEHCIPAGRGTLCLECEEENAHA